MRTSAVDTPLIHITVSAPVREQMSVYTTTYRFLIESFSEKRTRITRTMSDTITTKLHSVM